MDRNGQCETTPSAIIRSLKYCIDKYQVCCIDTFVITRFVHREISNFRLVYRWYPAKRALPAMLTHGDRALLAGYSRYMLYNCRASYYECHEDIPGIMIYNPSVQTLPTVQWVWPLVMSTPPYQICRGHRGMAQNTLVHMDVHRKSD